MNDTSYRERRTEDEPSRSEMHAKDVDPNDELRDLELASILGRPSVPESVRPWGLALSGGGIRSATFCLGMLQGLSHFGWLGGFHYLSTVSGGGYIGAYLQGMLTRKGFETTRKELDPDCVTWPPADRENDKLHAQTIRELRAYSNFLTPNKGHFSADRVTLATTFIGNMLLTQVQLIGWILLVLIVPYATYLLVHSIGEYLPRHTATPSIVLACILASVAMMVRGLDQIAADEASRAGKNYLSPNAAQFLPLALLSVAILTVAAMVGFGTPAEAFASGSVFVVAQLTWFFFWTIRSKHASTRVRDLFSHLFFGILAAVFAAFLLQRLSARLFGRVGLFVLFAIALPAAAIAYGPMLVEMVPARARAFAASAVPLTWGAIGAYISYFERIKQPTSQWTRRAADVLLSLAPVLIVAGALLLSVELGEVLMVRTEGAPADRLENISKALADPQRWNHIAKTWVMIATTVFLLRTLVDDNEFSMNGFYRNRLVRCYLAPSCGRRAPDPDMDLDPADDMKLAELSADSEPSSPRRGRPLYPLICATANLMSTRELDWQDRRAASFIFSPLFCGHVPLPSRKHDAAMGDPWPLEHRKSGEPSSVLPKELTLGTATSISGAAVSPMMGYHSSPAIAFLLTLFNARVGWWVRNLNAKPGLATALKRALLSKLLNELLSRSSASAPHTYISDGGHFENLGIYELVRRRCRFILSVDATADPDRDFESLGNAIHKCRVDLGAHIDIDVSLMRPDANGVSRRFATLGKIHYENKDEIGLIVYVKPSLLGNETADITHYASAHAQFPHEPTSDQFFDERQFEAYRELGFVSGERLFGMTKPDSDDLTLLASLVRADLSLEGDEEKESLLVELEHRLYEPSDATALRFSKHGEALSRLLERQRNTPALACMDAQLYRGWNHAVRDPRTPPPLPEDDQFRPCFYFAQEIVQLMEAVYLDLDLERNVNHPDNRGWINYFRQWTTVPMVRLVWALGSQAVGRRFARFCESRLGMPRLGNALRVHWMPTRGNLAEDAARWLDANRISPIEHEILTSKVLRKMSSKYRARVRVGLLQFEWHKIFERFASKDLRRLRRFNLGMMVALGKRDSVLDTLLVGRVQNHVRRLGLGNEMVYLAVKAHPKLMKARIASTDYGRTIGKINASVARRQERELQDLLDRAQARLGGGEDARRPK